ncbi:MAG: hypothetical protein Kow00121_48290 [Elainellaceae cyanobacterium]
MGHGTSGDISPKMTPFGIGLTLNLNKANFIAYSFCKALAIARAFLHGTLFYNLSPSYGAMRLDQDNLL